MTLSKKILLGSFAAAMAFSGASLAGPGFYIGAQGGWSNANIAGTKNYKEGNTSYNDTYTDGKGTSYGIRAGYQFDQNWALEAGWLRGKEITLDSTKTDANGEKKSKTTVTPQIFDAVGKYTFGFDNGFGAYAKAGIANVRGSFKVFGVDYGVMDNVTRPTAGLGVKYDINQNVSVDFGVNRIFKGG
ncbi:MAG: outer membrane beta-barrel protein, partial [Gammaproteobacteria bacterium]